MAPVLDRREHFDEKSREYPINRLLSGTAPRRAKVWRPRWAPLDQGEEGACVGHAWSGNLAATPHRHRVDNTAAFALYRQAQSQDRAMGNDWPAGASILAGAKAAVADGKVASYRWAFGVDEVIDTLVQHGPVVLGIPWHDGMYRTADAGLVQVAGPVVGGHAIMANGYLPRHPRHGEVVAWTNSWGLNYGLRGRGFIRVTDLDALLKARGEACIPTDRPL